MKETKYLAKRRKYQKKQEYYFFKGKNWLRRYWLGKQTSLDVKWFKQKLRKELKKYE